MSNEYGNDILTLEDETGAEHSFEVLDAIDTGEDRYLAMTPVFDDPEELLEDSGDLVIVKVIVDENGEEVLVTIDDEDEMDEIADIFMERLEQDYDIVAEDDQDE